MGLRTIRERFHNCNGDEEVFKILTQGGGGNQYWFMAVPIILKLYLTI